MEDSWDWQMAHEPDARFLKKEDFQDYVVKSYDGYELHAAFLPAKKETDRYVILCHGYTDTRYGMIKYLRFFHALDVHCVIYDERGHGENLRCPCSFGIREAKDLMVMIEDTYKRYGENLRLGMLGESLGGATVLTALQYNPKVAFVVDDCGFSDIVPVLKDGVRKNHLLGGMVYLASFMAKLLYGASFTAARPVAAVKGNRIPLLIMHGAEDDFILPFHSEAVKAATEGYVELHLFPGAGHAGSAIVSPEEYARLLKQFLLNISFLTEET